MTDWKGTAQRTVDGFASAFQRGTNAYYFFPIEEYDKLRRAWMAGEAFVELADYDSAGDSVVVLRLADICAVGKTGAATYLRQLEREAEETAERDRLEKKAKGGFDV